VSSNWAGCTPFLPSPHSCTSSEQRGPPKLWPFDVSLNTPSHTWHASPDKVSPFNEINDSINKMKNSCVPPASCTFLQPIDSVQFRLPHLLEASLRTPALGPSLRDLRTSRIMAVACEPQLCSFQLQFLLPHSLGGPLGLIHKMWVPPLSREP